MGNPLGGERAWMSLLDFREVVFGKSIADIEIGVFCEKAEVRERIHLGAGMASLPQLGLGEDVMDFQPAHSPKQARF